MAQRVMDCGDAGHIFSPNMWRKIWNSTTVGGPTCTTLGECEVKHGVRVGVVNLYGEGIGNPQLPKRFQALKKHRVRDALDRNHLALLLLAGIVAAFVVVSKRSGTTINRAGEKYRCASVRKPERRQSERLLC